MWIQFSVSVQSHALASTLSLFSFLGTRGASWGRRTGSGPASPRGGARRSAGGAGWILTAIILHRSYTPLSLYFFNLIFFFDYVRTVKGIFPHFYFSSSPRLSTWRSLLNRSTITGFCLVFFVPLCSLFNVSCDFWWTAVAGLWR